MTLGSRVCSSAGACLKGDAEWDSGVTETVGSINQKIVAWAHGKLKKQVGNGECWDLADQALRHAGARSSTTIGKNDDYVWGTEIPLNAVIPGDILQFRNVKPGGNHVQLHTLPTRVGTTVTTEHKVLKTSTGGMATATVVTTVTVSISGKVWAYRPVPASAGK